MLYLMILQEQQNSRFASKRSAIYNHMFAS
jgi:hypothetical protein